MNYRSERAAIVHGDGHALSGHVLAELGDEGLESDEASTWVAAHVGVRDAFG
jgi:hypothetical protein